MAELKLICGRIRDHVDPDGPQPLAAFEKRELLRGQLDPEGGAAVSEALDALMRPPAPDDARTPKHPTSPNTSTAPNRRGRSIRWPRWQFRHRWDRPG